MENKFTSLVYEEERSTYTEAESRSKISSILKPPKARAPLQEVNLGGSADETGEFDTLRKRRVSFAGVNSVKEFCSNAESAQVCHIQSYEETFSTSSDNSHNSSGAKSQLGTPKNVNLTEDKNFADDPMDLTDSIVDNNPNGPNSSARVVRVEPVLTANALTEGTSFLRNPQGQTWNARKSALEHEEGQSWNARSSRGPNWTGGGEGSSVNPGGESFGAVPRLAKPEELVSPHWSCSMEMTEPVHVKKRMSTVQPSDTPFHFGQNSSKPESDSGMEFTEAVGKIPNFLVDDNLGDASMEMTEVINRGRKSVAFTSSTKSASMEFTEVIRKNQTPFNFAQSPFSGMELTEPVMAAHHEPMARHSLFTSVEQGKPLPRVSYSSTPGKSALQSPGNKSSSDMEMTGILSLSKACRLVANQEADDDMDFTQIIMPSMPLTKKSRLSTEDDDDPFPVGCHLETDPADKENLKLPLVELSVSNPGFEAQQLPVTESVPKSNIGKPAEDEDDTLALNFKNVKDGNSPVELSFLKEFKDSSPVSEPPVKLQIDLFSSKKPLQYDVPDDHLLLFSLSKTEDVGPTAPAISEAKRMEKEVDFNCMVSPEPNEIPPVVSSRLSAPIREGELLSSRPEPFTDEFLARPKGSRSDVEQLRGVRKSSDAENDNHLPPLRMSFKDFEIKADLTTTVMMNTSLSTVGLDDSNILKAGFNDLTCPMEQVPACVSQLDITTRTTRPSGAGNTSLARSMTTPHVPGLDSIAENSPNRPEIIEAGMRKSENAIGHPCEEDNTTHTSFSRPFYVPIPDKLDTNKHGQSFPALELEPTEVGFNHMEVTDMSTMRQSVDPSVPRKSLLPQNLPESRSMELADVLNQKSVPSDGPSMNPGQVSAKHDCTDMELSMSICTDETLLRKSLPSFQANEQSPERPSSMDETNLAEPATIFKEISKKISQPAHDSPVSIASEETVCKSNVTTCAVELIENGSGHAMETEKAFAKSEITSDLMPSQFVESAKNVSRLSQPHPKPHFFLGMNCIEETVSSELTDNHLINAGLNSTFSFHNFGSKGSAENVLEPPRKSGPAFANVASGFHDDTTRTGEKFCAADRARNIQDSCVPLRSEVQPEGLMIGRDTKEALAVDHSQPKSRVRMSRKSDFFGNLEEDEAIKVQASKIRPRGDENYEAITDHESNRKSAGFLVGSHLSRKSVRVIPISNEEPSDILPPKLPERHSENTGSRKSRGFSAQDAVQVQRRSGFHDLVSETLSSSRRPVEECSEREFNQKSAGLENKNFDSRVSRKSVKITPNSSNERSNEACPSTQPSEGSLETAVDNSTECNLKPVGILGIQDVNNQAPRKSVRIAPNFSGECSCETLPSSQPPHGSLERAIDEGVGLGRESISQEVDPQAPKKSVRITRNFNAEPTVTVSELLEANSECAVDESKLHRKSVGFCVQEIDGQVPRKSVRIFSPEISEEPCDVPQFQGGSADFGDVDNSRENHSNDEESLESPTELPKRMPRKSCIGVKMDSSSEIEEDKLRKVSLGDVSEEFEFAIKRTKRKSAVGVKTAPDAESDKESQNPEIDSGIKVSNDDVQPGWSTDDDHKMSLDDRPDDHLTQGMMNVSINDDDVNDFSDDERMHVSTPCKPRLSSRLRGDDGRKRSLKPDTKSTSDDGGVHDLSQDLMNVSLESDTRSPMLKKTCASPQVQLSTKSDSVWESLAPLASPLPDKSCFARKSLAAQQSPPAVKSSSARESLAPQKSLLEQRLLTQSSSTLASGSKPSSSTWTGESGVTESYGSRWGLSYDIRVKNRDFMAENGFTHLNRQIYEVWLFGEVIGLKATFSNCELDEDTDIIGVTYTFKHWKLRSANCKLHEDVFEFYKNRLLERLPEQRLKRECRRAKDLFRIARDLKKLNADSKPLIERMTYLKLRYPCQINKDSVEFLIQDASRMLKFAVKIDLRNDCLGEDSISVTNLRGQVKEDVIKLMFRVLTPREDTFYTFVKELRNNTELLVTR